MKISTLLKVVAMVMVFNVGALFALPQGTQLFGFQGGHHGGYHHSGYHGGHHGDHYGHHGCCVKKKCCPKKKCCNGGGILKILPIFWFDDCCNKCNKCHHKHYKTCNPCKKSCDTCHVKKSCNTCHVKKCDSCGNGHY